MPVITAERLQDFTERVFVGLRSPLAEARRVAEILVESNLAGHDSHGVIRIPQYVRLIKDGQIRPGAPIAVEKETPATAIVNGHMNFGHVTMLKALDIACEKAEKSAVATVMACECNHIGRLGAYSQRAAQRGFACMAAINAPGSRCVVPWGGIDRRMGTNPFSLSAPTRGEPLVLDMTTSVVAEGKVRVLHHKREAAPADWIVDHEGRPTTSTADFYAEPPGALLPLGGSVGYKGFGLSVMLDILCGGLSGQGAFRPELGGGCNGVWLNLWRIDAFVPTDQFLAEVDTLAEHIKSSRRRPGVDEILLPGEIEARTANKRIRDGIPIPDETWDQIRATAAEIGVEL